LATKRLHKTSFLLAIVLVLLFVSHLPFLSADADYRMSTGSRGAWSDEGLNTSQIRNFVNHGYFDLLECDNFLKAPLLSVYLYLPFKIFGTKWEVARIATVLFLILMLWLFGKRDNRYRIIFILAPILLFFLPIHQHSHFSLAEIYAASLVMLSALYYAKWRTTARNYNLFSMFIVLIMALSFKVQFVYVLLIPLGAYLVQEIKQPKMLVSKQMVLLVLVIAVVSVLFWVCWFLPFTEEWKLVAQQQSGSFSLDSISWYSFKENLSAKFFSDHYLLFTIVFLACLVMGVFLLVSKKVHLFQKTLLYFAIGWFMVECHKLPMNYLPVRYLISLYFSMGFVSALVISELLSFNNLKIKWLTSIVLLIISVYNFFLYMDTISKRNFTILEASQFLEKRIKANDKLLGVWGTSVAWNSKAYSLPIWHDFLTTDNIIERYNPDVIVSELNEEDSGYAYQLRNHALDSISDSSKVLKLASWDMKVYWLKK